MNRYGGFQVIINTQSAAEIARQNHIESQRSGAFGYAPTPQQEMIKEMRKMRNHIYALQRQLNQKEEAHENPTPNPYATYLCINGNGS